MTIRLPSEQGWVRTRCDPRYWIPCPAAFPTGIDRDSWAADMAHGWLQRAGLPLRQTVTNQLAAMLMVIHREGYAQVPCHQIWIYLRDYAVPPLPVHIGIWKMAGGQASRLRMLAGVDDEDLARPPAVLDFATRELGTGVRAIGHKQLAVRGGLWGVLAYAFRVPELCTDVQIWTSTSDLRQLHRAIDDIDDFVRGVSVYPNPL